jgi:ABC-type sugar transport system permease subunit
LRGRHSQFYLLVPLVLVLLPFLILPALLGLASSFTDYAPARPHVHIVGLSNYAAVLQDAQLRAALRNVAILAVAAVPVELLIGFAIAYALREPFRGRGVIRMLLLVPWSVSPIATGVMWHFLYNSVVGLPNFWLASLRLPPQPSPLGLTATALSAVAVVELWRKAPFAGFLLLPGLLAIPADLWEQATLDGTGPFRRIRYLIAPQIFPLLVTVAALLAADTLGIFETVLMMTGGGPGSSTLTPALYSYRQAFVAGNWPAGVASAWVVAAAVLLVGAAYLFVMQRTADEAAPAVAEESGREARPRPWNWARGAVIGVSLAAVVLPLIWTVLASLGVVPDDAARPPAWAMRRSEEQYAELVASLATFPRVFATSLAISAASTLLTIVIAFLASYGVSRWLVRGAPAMQGLLVLAVLPAMAYVIPLSDLARRLHFQDTFAGVTLVSAAVNAPLAVFVLYGYMVQLSPAVEEMARLDGASLPRVLWACVAPAATPGLAAASVLVFILNWNLFLVPLTIALPHIRTITVTLSDVFLFERNLEWTTAAAVLVISLLPAVVLVAAAHEVLERFSLGAVEANGRARAGRPVTRRPDRRLRHRQARM